ncbi:MAG: hypothetical protein L0Z48_06020 [candidate division Zixibacteria bacterium]|nr:hypothetical protein [candidate division Zixibacteria bacterium]
MQSLKTMFQGEGNQKPAAALAMFLAAASALPLASAPAQAQDAVPVASSQRYAAPADYNFGDAADYSAQNNTVGVWVSMPRREDYTPEQVAFMIERKLREVGIPQARAFPNQSPDGTGVRIVAYINGELYENPVTGTADFNLGSIGPQRESILAAYRAKNSTASAEDDLSAAMQ